MTALLKEIELQQHYLSGEVIETIYFGGGTPSLLEIDDILSLIKKISGCYKVAAQSEITIEANPDDINEEMLAGWKQAGINRLSTGIQSFFDEDLEWMNRAHNAQQAIESLYLAAAYFKNITADLIYGTPFLTDERWQQNVEKMLALNIPHLSCYALTVEPKTPLHKLITLHKSPDTDADRQAGQFLLLMEWLENAGYEHYEISNFGLPGFRSRHNSSYWQGKKYLGIGPSAHSFDGGSRQWNIANNNIYIESLSRDIIPFEKEILTATQKLNEYIMTALRTREGIDLTKLENDSAERLLSESRPFAERGLLYVEKDCLKLTREGKLMADGIAGGLFTDQ